MIIMVILCHFAIMPGIELVWYTAIPQTQFKAELQNYIAPGTKFSDVVFDDIYLTAWDMKNRKPAMMTKQTVDKTSAANLSMYDDLLTAT